MALTTVAVIGASSPSGRAVVGRLDAEAAVTRILAVDVDEPEMPSPKLEHRVADRRDPLLATALDGADAVVLLVPSDPVRQAVDTRFALTVGAMRTVLDAAAKVDARTVVLVSSGTVYGAHSDNPIPIGEDAPRRANRDFPHAYHRMLMEELLEEWAGQHPGTRTVILRAAPLLGADQDDLLTRYLEQPRLPVVTGCHPPLQFLHVEDLAAAVALAVTGELSGVYNVAAEGWLPSAEVSAILGRRRFAVPEQVAFSAAEALYERGLAPVPPGAVHFAMHPCVLATERLREAGWAPTRSNRDLLREFATTHAGIYVLGPARVRRRVLVAPALAWLAGAAGVVALARRRRQR